MRHGYGVQMWPDGAKYEGYWKNDKAHGKGKFYHVEGDVYDGDWAQDKVRYYILRSDHRHTGTEFTHTRAEPSMRATGKMIFRMAMVSKLGKTAASTKATTRPA